MNKPPQTHVDDDVIADYALGMPLLRITKLRHIDRRRVRKMLRAFGIAPRRALAAPRYGPANHAWKGPDASYFAKHMRVSQLRGRPQRCEKCGTTDPMKKYQWASLTKNYDDVNDYRRLCVSCHRQYDREAYCGPRSDAMRLAQQRHRWARERAQIGAA